MFCERERWKFEEYKTRRAEVIILPLPLNKYPKLLMCKHIRSMWVFTCLFAPVRIVWYGVQTLQQGELKKINGNETVNLNKVWKYVRNFCLFLSILMIFKLKILR